MLRNYVTTALRALRRNWNYTIINVVGLTFGLACCLLLFLTVQYELSYDRHHTQADRIYRVVLRYLKSESDGRNTGVPLPALAGMKTDFPDLKRHISMTYEISNVVVRTNGPGVQKFEEPRGVVAFVEPSYFRMFDYTWKNGSGETSLSNPNTVVLSEGMARKYFGSANPMGKTLRVNNKMDFTVTGIIANPPVTSSLPFEMLLSFASLRQYGANTDWEDWQSTYSGGQMYVMLPPNQAAAQVEQQMIGFVQKHLPADDARDLRYELQPLTRIHFDSRTGNYANRTVSPQMIWSMSLIGAFILLIACVNFVNLATAQAIRRSKEVGIRKSLGSSRGQLIRQFLGETALLTTLSILFALAIAIVSLPYVAELLDVKLTGRSLFGGDVLGFLVLLGVLTTLLAGFYPALVLSGYQPVLALKGKIRTAGSGQLTLRRSLIVVQFAISQVLVIGTIVAYTQMKHFRSADLGYRKDAVITVPIPDRRPGQLENLRAKLVGLPNVQSLSYSISAPSSNGNWSTSFRFENAQKEADFGVVMRPADTTYFQTYGLQLLAGRLYLPADTMREYVVNESFAKRLGFKDPRQIVGKLMSTGGPTGIKKPIVGVVKDFHVYSLHRRTDPCLLTTHRDAYNTLSIKLAMQQGGAEAITPLLREVEKNWTATFPDFVFKYEFLDEALADFYRGEERLFSLFRLLAGIALFIGCLGLYGVVAFMAEARTREVGIRKTLGATTFQIFGLFSVDFLRLVLIALVIASPIAWYVMNQWLSDFEYKISIEWWVFVLTGISAICIALLTVSFQSIKAALMNPVQSLRAD